MDPVSVTAGVAGILGGVATVAVKLSTLKQRYDQAELNITLTASLLISVKRALEAIQRLREQTRGRSAATQHLDDDLAVPLESCAVLIAMIEKALDGIDVENPSRSERWRFVALNDTFDQAERSLDAQVRALQLMLTIYQCGTLAEQTERLNRRDTRRVLDEVKQETASAFQRLEETDVGEAASILSREPSIKFRFDYEILQSPMYKRVYSNLYLKYRPESSRNSVGVLTSPRQSIVASPPSQPPPPVPVIPDAAGATDRMCDPTLTDNETIRDHRLSRPSAAASPPVQANPEGAETADARPRTDAFMLSPKSAEKRGHKKRRSTSSLRGPDPMMPDIMFLGVPFKGETRDSSSSESESEEERPAEEAMATALPQSTSPAIEENTHPQQGLEERPAKADNPSTTSALQGPSDRKLEAASRDRASTRSEEDLYGVSDDEVDPPTDKPDSPAKGTLPELQVPAPPTKRHSSHSIQMRSTEASLTVDDKITERPSTSSGGIFLFNEELQRLQEAVRQQRARARTESAAPSMNDIARSDDGASKHSRSASDGQRLARSSLHSRDVSPAPSVEPPERPAQMEEVEKEQSFSPKIDVPALGTEASAFNIDFGEHSATESPVAADSTENPPDRRPPALPITLITAPSFDETAVPAPLIVQKTPPPVPAAAPPLPPHAASTPPSASAPAAPKRVPPMVPPKQSLPSPPPAVQASTSPRRRPPPPPPATLTSPSVHTRPSPSPVSPNLQPPATVPPAAIQPGSIHAPSNEQEAKSLPPVPQRPMSSIPSSYPPPSKPYAMRLSSSPKRQHARSASLTSHAAQAPAAESVGISVEPSKRTPPVPPPQARRPSSPNSIPELSHSPVSSQYSGPASPPVPPKFPYASSAQPIAIRTGQSPRLSQSSRGSQPMTPEVQNEGFTLSPVQSNLSSHQSPFLSQSARPASHGEAGMQEIPGDDASTVASAGAGSRASSSYNDAGSVARTYETAGTRRTGAETVPTRNSSFSETRLVASEFSQADIDRKLMLKKLKHVKQKNTAEAPAFQKLRGKASISKIFMTKEKSTKIKFMHEAASKGDRRALMEYLNHNIGAINKLEKIDDQDSPKTLLMRAAEGDHVECMEQLIVNGAEFAHRDKNGCVALHHAVQAGSVKATWWLIQRFHAVSNDPTSNAPVGPLEIGDHEGFRPLHLAAGTGNIEIMIFLLDRGAKIDARDRLGRPPLYAAITAYRLDAIKVLLARGASLSISDDEERGPLMWASQVNAQKAVELLLEKGADRHARDINGNTAIHLAAQAGSLTIVEMLYLSLKDLEATNKDGERPLHLAAGADQPRVVKALLRIGCDPNNFSKPSMQDRLKTKSPGYKMYAASPLHYACGEGAYDPATHLIDHGALVNSNQEDGRSALMLAAAAKSAPLCGLLIQHGASINAQTTAELLTPLHIGLAAGDVEVVKILATNGANVRTVNRKGQSPYAYATKNGQNTYESSRWLSQFTGVQHAVLRDSTNAANGTRPAITITNNAARGANQPGANDPYARPSVPSHVFMVPAGYAPMPYGPELGPQYWQMTQALANNVTATGYAVNPTGFYQPPHIQASNRTDEGIEPPPAYSPPATRPAP